MKRLLFQVVASALWLTASCQKPDTRQFCQTTVDYRTIEGSRFHRIPMRVKYCIQTHAYRLATSPGTDEAMADAVVQACADVINERIALMRREVLSASEFTPATRERIASEREPEMRLERRRVALDAIIQNRTGGCIR